MLVTPAGRAAALAVARATACSMHFAGVRYGVATLALGLTALLGPATSRAARHEDFIAAAVPSCAVLRDAMQSECWAPLVTLWERGTDATEGTVLGNRCDALYEAALISCPSWPRTPRTAAWRVWYRRVREWGLPVEPSRDDRAGCTPEDGDDCG